MVIDGRHTIQRCSTLILKPIDLAPASFQFCLSKLLDHATLDQRPSIYFNKYVPIASTFEVISLLTPVSFSNGFFS